MPGVWDVVKVVVLVMLIVYSCCGHVSFYILDIGYGVINNRCDLFILESSKIGVYVAYTPIQLRTLVNGILTSSLFLVHHIYIKYAYIYF